VKTESIGKRTKTAFVAIGEGFFPKLLEYLLENHLNVVLFTFLERFWDYDNTKYRALI
jgi:hypothetical protein